MSSKPYPRYTLHYLQPTVLVWDAFMGERACPTGKDYVIRTRMDEQGRSLVPRKELFPLWWLVNASYAIAVLSKYASESLHATIEDCKDGIRTRLAADEADAKREGDGGDCDCQNVHDAEGDDEDGRRRRTGRAAGKPTEDVQADSDSDSDDDSRVSYNVVKWNISDSFVLWAWMTRLQREGPADCVTDENQVNFDELRTATDDNENESDSE